MTYYVYNNNAYCMYLTMNASAPMSSQHRE